MVKKKNKKIMMKIVATNVVASRPPERQGSPATTIACAKSIFFSHDVPSFSAMPIRSPLGDIRFPRGLFGQN